MSKKNDKRQKQLARQKIVKFLKGKPNSSYSEKQIAKKIGFTQPIKKKLKKVDGMTTLLWVILGI